MTGQGAGAAAILPPVLSRVRSMAKVLIIEDQPAVSAALKVLLDIHGIPCFAAEGPEAALSAIAAEPIGAVIQDMNFSPGETSGRDGIELFRRIHSLDPDLPVLLLTAWTSLETAVHLTREGAADYVAKPWDDDKLVTTVRNLLRLRELHLENARLRRARARDREALACRHDLCGAVYASQEMHAVVSLAVQVARADVPVLVTGPSGAGKEKIAEIVHANSGRAGRTLVKVNGGAIPEDLLESELFGAEPGAFTDSRRRRIGRFEAADGGTLFLDEVGNVSAAGQMKLLRVLQSGEFERLGSSETRRADVRLISATNTDLKAAITSGRFREDLFFRINVIEIAVPPLADRHDDVLPLAEHFLRSLRRPGGGQEIGFGAEARRALVTHDWPGSVRELHNRVHRALLVAQGETISPADLGLSAPSTVRPAAPMGAPAPRDEDGEAERARIERALRDASGVVARAASRLGMSRQALYRRMDRLGIEMERRLKG